MTSPLSKLPFDMANTLIFPKLGWKKTLYFYLVVHPSQKSEIIKVVAQKVFDRLEQTYGLITPLERQESVSEFLMKNRDNRLKDKESIQGLLNWHKIVFHTLPHPKTLKEFLLVDRRTRKIKEWIDACKAHLERDYRQLSSNWPARSVRERETRACSLNINFEGQEHPLCFHITNQSSTSHKFSIILKDAFEIVVENFFAMYGFPNEYRIKLYTFDHRDLIIRFVTQLIFEIFQEAVIHRGEKVRLVFNEHRYSIEDSEGKIILYDMCHVSVDQIGSVLNPVTDWNSEIEKQPILPKGFKEGF